MSPQHYEYDQKPGTRFSPEAEKLLAELRNAEYSVLVGRNNCGKSFILRTLAQRIGINASYIGPARYQNFHILSPYSPNRHSNRKQDRYNSFIQQWLRETGNFDNSPWNLQQAIAELSNERRQSLREIVKLLLGLEIEILHTVANNDMSQKYISAGGHNISFTSSGFRLITVLITCLLEEGYDTFLIDEPELGISPEAQGIVAEFLFDRAHRQKYFSHIKSLVFATHSTVFLDRQRFANNYSIHKTGDEITVKRASSQSEFNAIHFFLLGNRLEHLFMPSFIVLVEGKSDHAFIQRFMTAKYPNFQCSIINAGNDGHMKVVLKTASHILTDLQRSPYRDRIFAILDAVHGADIRSALMAMGLPPSRIIVWSQNGIEHVYPAEIMDQIFGVGGQLSIDGDRVTRNLLSYTKAELASKVANLITPETKPHEEFQAKLLDPIDHLLGLTPPIRAE